MRALPLSVLLALAIGSSTIRAAAQESQSGLLDGIEVKDFQGQKVYQSRIEPWPVHDILISAIILEIGTSRRELFLGVSLWGVHAGKLGRLRFALDGSTVVLDLGAKGDAVLDTSGCRPKAVLTLNDEESLVRRLAASGSGATADIPVEYESRGVLLKGVLTTEDRERFRRIVDLYEMTDLPPAPRPPEYKDGQFVGLTLEDVTAPEIIPKSKVTPKCPARARASRKSGQVVLVATILKDGTIGTLRPVQVTGGGCGFAEASMEAVKQWKYHPAMKAGQPVEVEFTIVVDFVLR